MSFPQCSPLLNDTICKRAPCRRITFSLDIHVPTALYSSVLDRVTVGEEHQVGLLYEMQYLGGSNVWPRKEEQMGHQSHNISESHESEIFDASSPRDVF